MTATGPAIHLALQQGFFSAALALIFSLFLGFSAALLYAWLVYWLDRYEKEPGALLGGVFLWGALVAAGGAFLINTVLGVGVYLFTGSELAAELTTGSVIAPLVEESLKGFAVLMVYLIFRDEFDSILDGIVYAGIVALGFSATENVYYIFNFGYLEAGVEGLFALAFIRLILVGWQHPFYTAFTGIGLAVSRLSRNELVGVLAPILGWSLAVAAHAAHNTLASFIASLESLAFTTLLDWTGWLFMFGVIIWAILRERNWIVRHLEEEVSLGTLSEAQYRVACSAWRQSLARLRALVSGRYRLTRRFYQRCAELAYKKHHLARFGDETGNAVAVESLRAELAGLSAQVARGAEPASRASAGP